VDRQPRRIPSGVPTLDALLHGGLPQGHSTLVVGPTGSGKTILSTLFLAEGARQGEHGVALYFEKGTSRLRNARLADLVQSGKVTIVESRQLDLTVEELLEELLDTVRRTGARRVVIDSLSEFSLYLAPEYRENLRLAVFRILSELAKLDVTALLTVGLEDRFTELRFGQADISFLTDAVIAIRYVEIRGRLEKVISVVKVRGVPHSHDLRTFQINDDGITIDAEPLRAEGLLSGHPSLRMN
jgi:circadian clock protein KaiC